MQLHTEVLGAALFEQGRRGETLALEQFDLGFYDEALSIDQYVRRSVLANGNFSLRVSLLALVQEQEGHGATRG